MHYCYYVMHIHTNSKLNGSLIKFKFSKEYYLGHHKTSYDYNYMKKYIFL